jgi:hypothetical protein
MKNKLIKKTVLSVLIMREKSFEEISSVCFDLYFCAKLSKEFYFYFSRVLKGVFNDFATVEAVA